MKKVLFVSFCLIFLSSCSLASFAQGSKASYETRSCVYAGSAAVPTHKIFLINLGWHTGLLLQSKEVSEKLKSSLEEFREYPFVEIGWGDRDFYRSSGYSVWQGFKALFFSSGAVLHVAGFVNLQGVIAGNEVVELEITDDGFKKLENYILQSLVLDSQNGASPCGPSLYGSGHFYEAKGEFGIGYTCNSWVSEALVQAGCGISNKHKRSSGLLDEVRELRRNGVN